MTSKNHGNTAILIGIVILLVLTVSAIGFSKPMIVLSGSMEPIMMMGDIILVVPAEPEDIEVLDIIAFIPERNPNIIITHRVISISEEGDTLLFETKGDANEDADRILLPSSNMVGKAVFVLPFLGYLPEVTNNPKVFFIVVIIPALLIIFDEILTIIKYSNPITARKAEKEDKKTPRKIARVANWKLLIVIVSISFSGMLLLSMPYITGSGHTSGVSEYVIENNGVFTCSYIASCSDQIPIYGTIPPGNETSLSFKEEESCMISITPIALPVFWADSISKLNSAFPCFLLIKLFTMFMAFVSIPLWYRKPKYLRRKKPGRFSF